MQIEFRNDWKNPPYDISNIVSFSLFNSCVFGIWYDEYDAYPTLCVCLLNFTLQIDFV